MMKSRAALACLLSVILWPLHALAQDTSPFSYITSEGAEGILLNGQIDFRSPLAFRRIMEAHPSADIVALNSVGGSVQAALLIAEEIYARGMSTVIPREASCDSACSFIFFAGRGRLVVGSLGVHQVSGSTDISDAQLNLSDVLELLSKYGVAQPVITKMLRTPPNEIYTFSKSEIAEYGIDVYPTEHTRDPETSYVPLPTRREAYQPSMESIAQEVVAKAIKSGTLPEKAMLSATTATYSDRVNFFGKARTLPEVIAEKIQYAHRWPVRTVTVDQSSVSSFCGLSSCIVAGRYTWMVFNPTKAKTLKGLAEFSYEVDRKSLRIIAENGKVLARN